MSNQVVGPVYLQVIEKVIAASQNDFEEFGVDQSTLDEMKQGWQEKLSALKIAAFPWDPQPEPPRQPPTVPSMKNDAVAPQSHSAPQDHINFPNAGIKTERGYDAPMSSYPQQVPVQGYNQGFNGDIAQQRAHALVAQRLHASQQGQQHMPQQHQQQQQHQQHGGQVPMHPQQQQRMMQQGQQRPPQQQMQQRPQQPHVYQTQTDGAGDALADWNAFKAAREAAGLNGPEGRLAADMMMRAQLDALSAREDTGLGMPLSEMPKGRKRKNIARVLQRQEVERSSSGPSSLPPARFDGGDEDVKEEDPDDAINSDLDDPDDDDNGADGSDDDTMDYMLCTYDKVQRVKNKWKCTLKDGILCTNKKEYLFHKATAELEF